jgi:hypothetical protein
MILLGHIATGALALAALTGAALLTWHARMSKKRHVRRLAVWANGKERFQEDLCWALYRQVDYQRALRIASVRHSDKLLELIRG